MTRRRATPARPCSRTSALGCDCSNWRKREAGAEDAPRQIALNWEISVCAGLRGGAWRTRTSNQSVMRNLFFRLRILQVVAMDVAKPSPFIGGQIFFACCASFYLPSQSKANVFLNIKFQILRNSCATHLAQPSTGSPARSIPIQPRRASRSPPIRGSSAAFFKNLSAAAKLRSRGVDQIFADVCTDGLLLPARKVRAESGPQLRTQGHSRISFVQTSAQKVPVQCRCLQKTSLSANPRGHDHGQTVSDPRNRC